MNIFTRMMKDIVESKEGRIRRVPAHWKLAPEETRDDGSYAIPGAAGQRMLETHVRVSTDKLGRKMHLTPVRGVHCPNPEYMRDFASISDDRVCVSVPDAFCRKCMHYRTSRATRRKYATCAFKASENPSADAVKEFAEMFGDAAEKAREIMGY